MRVIAGTARRLHLITPEGLETRPTTDRIKETLFNMIQDQVPGSIFVDLYAGSGGIGIEALSRGARHCYFVENAPEPLRCIEENLRFTKLKEAALVLKMDAVSALQHLEQSKVTADVIFMDPPYRKEEEKRVLNFLKDSSVADGNTLIIIEASADTTLDYLEEFGFEMIKYKKYGSNAHIFVKKVQKG